MIFLSCMKHAIEVYRIFFVSLANPNRLQILNALRYGEKNVTDICNATKFEQTMVSHNLRRLLRCGMVKSVSRGKFRYYTINQKTIKPLMNLIDSHMEEYCCKLLGKHEEKHK